MGVLVFFQRGRGIERFPAFAASVVTLPLGVTALFVVFFPFVLYQIGFYVGFERAELTTFIFDSIMPRFVSSHCPTILKTLT